MTLTLLDFNQVQQYSKTGYNLPVGITNAHTQKSMLQGIPLL
jgi:hypothetical protein